MKKFMINKRITNYGMLLIAILIFSNFLFAQSISTYVINSGLNGPDGFAIDNNGNLYIANWGNGTGSTILKVSERRDVTTYIDGLHAPDGLAFDSKENLYISNYVTGIINKVTPTGEMTVFASGLNSPSDLAFDQYGNLYVSNHGNGQGSTVSKISKDGIVNDFANGFDAPLGLVFDQEGNLYVSNYNSGVINKVTIDGVVSVYAAIPNSPLARLQYLIFDEQGNLYVPSYGHNKIYKILTNSEVVVFAGTGLAGGLDGQVEEAQFNGPNSIAIDACGIIYVSEYNANRIRKISQWTTDRRSTKWKSSISTKFGNSSMNIIPLLKSILYFSIISIILTGCKIKEDEKFDVDVSIIETSETTVVTREAKVKYTVENMGTNTISGWEVFFNVHFPSNPQLALTHVLSYTLEPGEISSIQSCSTRVPAHYDRYEEPRSASLKHINIY